MLTTDGMRFVSVPIVLILVCVVITVLQKGNFATYCDIQNCPRRNTGPRRDRVWEPVIKLLCQMQ